VVGEEEGESCQARRLPAWARAARLVRPVRRANGIASRLAMWSARRREDRVLSTALLCVGASDEAGGAGEEGKGYCVALGDVVGETEGRSSAWSGNVVSGE